MKVLIAGKGFIGEKIAEKLDAEVKFLSRNSGDYQFDITREFEIDEEFDVLIHTVGLEPGTKPRWLYEKVHIEGTRNLLEAVEADKTVYISALGVGKIDHSYMNTKEKAEELVKDEECWTIVRPSIVYGEGNVTFENITESAPLVLFPRLKMKMQPIHIEDFIDVMAAAVEGYDNEILEVGGPEQLYIHEIIRRYCREKGKKFYSFPMPDVVPKTGLKMLGNLPFEIPQLSRKNANLLTDNVIKGENDAERILGSLKEI